MDGPFPKLCLAVVLSHQDGHHCAVVLLLKAALIRVSDYRLLGASGLLCQVSGQFINCPINEEPTNSGDIKNWAHAESCCQIGRIYRSIYLTVLHMIKQWTMNERFIDITAIWEWCWCIAKKKFNKHMILIICRLKVYTFLYLLFCFDGLALLTLFLYSLLEDFYNSTNIIYIETY